MTAKLVIEDGDLKGLSLNLEDGDTWVVGRDPDECQLVIEDPLVSRRHLLIRRSPDGMVVENLSTTNPTQVNDEEMDEEPHLLQNGDALKVGNEILRYYAETEAQISEQEESFAEELEEEPQPLPEPKTAAEEPVVGEPAQELPSSADHDTLFEEEEEGSLGSLAEIDFGVIETGRWLLKVIGGPNNGAEFYMQAGNSYILGTDPQSCDIVFHDNSVSRQHAKVIVTPEDNLQIEDLKSRNGVMINAALIEGKQELTPNTIVTLGTTSFVVYDREGEMQTIISPLLPSIVKVLQQGESRKAEAEAPPSEVVEAPPTPPPTPALPPKPSRPAIAPLILIGTIIGLFILAGIGTTTLFHSEPIVVQQQENADELIQQALKPFPAVRYTFNKGTGSLLILGHVSTPQDKSQLAYNLEGLKFIKSRDDSGVVVDEYVWQEVNSILAKNPAWRGISIHSPTAGQFILSGYLKTRKEAEQLSSYINPIFPYLDLLKKQIIVEEDVVNQINTLLHERQLNEVVPTMANGEITLTGTLPVEKQNEIPGLIEQIKHIPGVRVVNNQLRTHTAETGTKDISEQYPVTGKSKVGNKYTVVINGRILSEGDELDGMSITKITTNRVSLEKDGMKFRIDY